MICLSCEDEGAQSGTPPALLARARRIEAEMDGERATEEAWRVFAGVAEGALPWTVTMRLMACMDAASSGRGVLVCR